MNSVPSPGPRALGLLIGLALVLSACGSVGVPPSPAGAAASSDAAAGDRLVVRGTLAYRARIALPPDAEAVIELRESGGDEAPLVAERRFVLGGRQLPVPFELSVDRREFAAGRDYLLRGALRVGGRPAWVGDPLMIDPGAPVVDAGTMMLRPIEALAFASRLRCGDRTATLGFDGDRFRLQAGGSTYTLRQVPAASGAKYEAEGDPTTVFWSRGARAMLTVRGEPWPECRTVASGSQALRARGNEPGWRLDVFGPMLRFETADGSARVYRRATRAGTPAGPATWTAAAADGPLVATVSETRCTDSMSGMPHPLAVRVSYQGRVYEGCGGDPATLLQGGEWVVEDIAGEGIVDRSRATLRFGDDGRLSGSASCNAYTGEYELTGEGLRIGRAATTRRACAPALMAQEQRLLEVMAAVQRFEIAGDGALVLVASDGRRIVARRA